MITSFININSGYKTEPGILNGLTLIVGDSLLSSHTVYKNCKIHLIKNGGIEIIGINNATIENCEFIYHKKFQGSAIRLIGCTEARIIGCYIHPCIAGMRFKGIKGLIQKYIKGQKCGFCDIKERK